VLTIVHQKVYHQREIALSAISESFWAGLAVVLFARVVVRAYARPASLRERRQQEDEQQQEQRQQQQRWGLPIESPAA
jgi:flagellar biosynthesis/type III secretory pathway M-ring protein FliF/YscJ